MINKNLIITVIIFLLLGLISGFFLGMNRWPAANKSQENAQPGVVANLTKLKMINDLRATASGTVSKISGKNLTLVSNGETLEIPIVDEAKVVIPILLSSEEMKENKAFQPPKEIKFEDIKIGDKADVTISITDNVLRGNYIIVFPK